MTPESIEFSTAVSYEHDEKAPVTIRGICKALDFEGAVKTAIHRASKTKLGWRGGPRSMVVVVERQNQKTEAVQAQEALAQDLANKRRK